MAAVHGYVLASMPCARMTKMPQAVLNKEHKMRVPYQLKQGQSRIFHELPSGLNMEVIYQKSLQNNEKSEELWNPPPLVFIHGSFHAAWCWAEHWLPFFSQHGFDSYALSLLGQVQFSLYLCIRDFDFMFMRIQMCIFVVGFSIFGFSTSRYVKFGGQFAQMFANFES